MKRLVVIGLVFVFILIPLMGVNCDSNGDKGQEELLNGELPTVKIGDKWVYEAVYDNVDYDITYEVVGTDTLNGKECYDLMATYSPAFYGAFNSNTARLYKANYQWAKIEYVTTLNGSPYLMVIEYSYTFPDSSIYPLEVGKEINIIGATTTTITYMGETETETVTRTYTDKVECMEEITVAAGTFKCFKTVRYDETGNKLFTSWQSDKTKLYVKFISHSTGDTEELKSYSV